MQGAPLHDVVSKLEWRGQGLGVVVDDLPPTSGPVVEHSPGAVRHTGQQLAV